MKKPLIFVLIFSFLLTLPVSAANVTTVEAIPQSTTAALNYLEESVGTTGNSYLIPGLMQSVTRTSDMSTVTTCDNMIPQALAFAGSGAYLLISAYCGCGEGHQSVVYVIDASTKEYQVTLILDTNCHVGGMACDGTYIWICDSQSGGKRLRAYKYSSLLDAIGHNYWTVYTQSTVTVDTTPSYMCWANNYLYVGTFSQTETTAKIYFYSVDGKTISKCGSFTVTGISKIQGMSIRKGNLMLTCSYGRTNTSDAYLFTDPGSRFVRDGATYDVSQAKHFKLPNMVEGCYIGSTYTYFLFESGAKTYRSSLNTRPLDKYVRLKHAVTGVTLLDGANPTVTTMSGVYQLLSSSDTDYALAASGSVALLQNRGEGLSQKFTLIPSENCVLIENDGKRLGVSGDRVVMASADGTASQSWVMLDNQDGTYSFVNEANGGYLTAGSPMQTTESDGSAAQKWVLEPTSLVDVSDLVFEQVALNVENDLSMQFLVREEALKGFEAPYATFRKPIYDEAGNITDTEISTTAEYQTVGSYRVYTFSGITAPELSSPITATLSGTCSGITYSGAETTCSVQEYSEALLSSSEDELQKNLLISLLNYGAAAQRHWSYHLTALANAGLSEEQKLVPTPTLHNDKAVFPHREATVKFTGCSLSLNRRITVNFYLTAEAVSDLSLALRFDGQTVILNRFEPCGSGYVVRYDGLTAAQLRTLLTAEVQQNGQTVSSTIRYSVESYAASMQTELTNAMMVYGDAAETYFSQLSYGYRTGQEKFAACRMKYPS